MSKIEKFTNRMESISSAKSDFFSTDIKINRSIWRNFSFSQQAQINRMIADINEKLFCSTESMKISMDGYNEFPEIDPENDPENDPKANPEAVLKASPEIAPETAVRIVRKARADDSPA